MTKTFSKQLHSQENKFIFTVFEKSLSDRTQEELERVVAYLKSIELFSKFPKNLLNQLARKFTPQVVLKYQQSKFSFLYYSSFPIVKHRNDD